MLSYFPSPYPGEWWYSVLCRYHVRSGNSKQQTTIRELFPGRVTAAIGSVYPNSTIRQVLTQLPPGLLDVRQVIWEHTLFPFFTRCYTLEKKQAVLERLLLGETMVITSVRRLSKCSEWRPRYCPLCVDADRKAYGEAYWHIAHQIPLLTICPQHGCALVPAENIEVGHMDYTFYPLEAEDPFASIDEDVYVPSWQRAVSGILHEYLTLPIDAAATQGYSNLAIALSNMGYGVIQKHSPNTILDGRRLYQDLIGAFGRELIEQVYGGEQSICNYNRLCKWEMVAPERYALLQYVAGIDSRTMFQSKKMKERLEERLLELRGTGVLYGKKQLAASLGVTVSQLDILAEKYHIKPFWTQNNTSHRAPIHKISISLNDEEHALFKNALHKSGYRYDKHFARHCVMEYIKQHDKEA